MATSLKKNLSLLCICLFAVCAAYGQNISGANAAPELNITLGEQRVRFAPTRSFQEMRLEVLNSVGEIVFTHLTTEAEFDWNLHAGNSEALAPGLYRYRLSLKFGADQSRQHTGHFIVEKGQDQIWLTASEGTEVSGTVLSASRRGGRSITGLGSKDDKSVKRDVSGREIGDKVADSANAAKQEKAALLGTANMVAKYDVGGVNLIDSAITEVGGNVGIGITTPTSILEMVRPGVTDVVFKMQNATRAWSVGVSGTGDLWRIRDNTAGAARLAVTGGTGLTGGYVGIGVTAPAAKLDIVGDLRSSALRQELTLVNPVPVPGPPNVINGFMGTGSSGATPGNRVTAGVVGASIGGGGFNGSLIPSDGPPLSGDKTNRVTDWFGTVGGGYNNRTGNNTGAPDDALFATVGGGADNIASNYEATVAGGQSNTASGLGATVGGGLLNQASGLVATIPGGVRNQAQGQGSFAAGSNAIAIQDGTFVWADYTNVPFQSTSPNQFLIRATGGVGIGTTTTPSPLTVAGVIESTSGGIKFPDGTTQTTAVTGGNGNFIQNSTALQASSNFNISGNGLIGGALGIGIPTPQGLFHVRNPDGSNFLFTGYPSNAGTQLVAEIKGSSGNGGQLRFSGAPNFVDIGQNAAGDLVVEDRFDVPILTVNGNGDTNNAVQITGDLRIGTAGTNGCLKQFDGTVIAGTCSSDLRFKREITSFPKVLHNLVQLRPVYYYWRAEEFPRKQFGNTQSYGLIAQEVEQTLPELVSEDAQGYKQVDYSKLPLLTLQAVKELKAENDALKARLAALELMLQQLTQQTSKSQPKQQ